MGLFGFDVGSRASGERRILKNLDCRRVSKDHNSSTKPSGETKPRPEESRKNQSVWRDSHVTAENREKSESKRSLYNLYIINN
jgi:hypothetical protein